MKSGVIYASKHNDRQWLLDDGYLKTRLPGDIWRPVGWPQPSMKISDVAYYIEIGDMYEVTE